MKYLLFSTMVCVSVVFPMHTSAAGAIVIKGFECPGFIPNPDTESGFPALAGLFTTQTHVAATGRHVARITCHFDHDFPLESPSVARGWTCAVENAFTGELVLTDNTVMLATPGGKAILQCMFGPLQRINDS